MASLLEWFIVSLPVYLKHFVNGPERWAFFVLIPAYIIAQPMLRSYLAQHDLYKDYRTQWKRLMITYNLLLSLFSLYCAVRMTRVVYWELPGNGYYIDSFNTSPEYSRIVYVFYLSKYVEFLDTMFLILQKKEVSLLQWIHHVGAPLNVGLLWLTQDPGAHLFVILNGFIHTLLYLYYVATISGIKIKGKWILTFMQITQFNVGFYLYTKFTSIPEYARNLETMASHLFTWCYVGLVEILFLHFFLESYILSSPKSSTAKGVINSYSAGSLSGDGPESPLVKGRKVFKNK